MKHQRRRAIVIGAIGAVVLCLALPLASSTVRGKLHAAYKSFRDPSLLDAPPPAPPQEVEVVEVPPVVVQPELEGDYELTAPEDLEAAGLDAVVTTLSDLPLPVTKRTMRYVEYFGLDEKGRKAFFERQKRSAKFREHIEQALRDANMPEDLLWLVAIESGFSPQAVSPVGATGLFQFMPETAQRYGLWIGDDIDERKSITKATDAAIAYLAELYERYGRWDLAIAAYNCGEKRVDEALEKFRAMHPERGKDPIAFHELAEARLLPSETANFVPQIHAFAIVAQNRGFFDLEDLDLPPGMSFAEVAVPAGTRLAPIAKAAGISISTLREYNPDLLGDRIPGKKGDHLVNIPSDRLERALASLPVHIARDEERLAAGEPEPERSPPKSKKNGPGEGAGSSSSSGSNGSGSSRSEKPRPRVALVDPLRPGAIVLENGIVVEIVQAAGAPLEITTRIEVLDPRKNRSPTGDVFTIAPVTGPAATPRTSLDAVARKIRDLALGDASSALRARLATARTRLLERTPFGSGFVALSGAAFPPSHPMAGAILIGPTEPADDMFLEPEPLWALDIVVMITGGADRDVLVRELEPALGDALVPTSSALLPPSSRKALGGSTPRLLAGWISPALGPRDQAAGHLAFLLACHNRVGRVHRQLRHERKIVAQLACSVELAPHASVAWFMAGPTLPYTVSDVEKELDSAIGALVESGPTDTELAAARALLKTELTRDVTTATMRGLPKQRIARTTDDILDALPGVDRAQVIAAAKRLFASDHRVVFTSGS